MTTVGYGDYYPRNGVAYVLAAFVMMLGLMLTALPIAVIGANFSTYYEYKKKSMKRKVKHESKNE